MSLACNEFDTSWLYFDQEVNLSTPILHSTTVIQIRSMVSVSTKVEADREIVLYIARCWNWLGCYISRCICFAVEQIQSRFHFENSHIVCSSLSLNSPSRHSHDQAKRNWCSSSTSRQVIQSIRQLLLFEDVGSGLMSMKIFAKNLSRSPVS